ncbi:MAG: hypothetical protein ABIG44_05400 [Planctomycetota bacterium]
MILLESGPAKTDRMYWLIVTLVFLGYGLWCLYDGLYRYHDQNRAQAAQVLRQRDIDGPYDLDRNITQDDFDALKATTDLKRDQVHAAFGEPSRTRREHQPGQGLTDTAVDTEYYLSRYGLAIVRISPMTSRVDKRITEWIEWEHSADDIRMQFYMGGVVGLVALFFLYRAYRAATLRAVMDADGLTYGGQRIAFADMVSLRDYNRKGWVDLYYRVGGSQKKLRIDNQKIAKFEEIVALLCEKKGFENPLKARSEEDETEVGQEEAAPRATGDAVSDQDRDTRE